MRIGRSIGEKVGMKPVYHTALREGWYGNDHKALERIFYSNFEDLCYHMSILKAIEHSK